MADDALIIGHRNSEWTGLGPILEEDIAFSSMAQDKIGHAQALYTILHEEFGEPSPDKLVYERDEKQYRCCHLVELPIGEYDFSLMRHFLFDHAEFLRYQLLANSNYERLAALSKKITGELKYHLLHADTWLKKLGAANEESRARLQSSLNEAYPYALGIFEKSDEENKLIKEGIFAGEEKLQQLWLEKIEPVINAVGLKLPSKKTEPALGGRKGFHTEHLQPLLDEMSEVYRLEPGAEW